jgi:hypothetical protein
MGVVWRSESEPGAKPALRREVLTPIRAAQRPCFLVGVFMAVAFISSGIDVLLHHRAADRQQAPQAELMSKIAAPSVTSTAYAGGRADAAERVQALRVRRAMLAARAKNARCRRAQRAIAAEIEAIDAELATLAAACGAPDLGQLDDSPGYGLGDYPVYRGPTGVPVSEFR